MSIKLDKYNPLIMYLSPASIPQIVAHIQDYLVKHPILSVETIAEIIVQSLQEHPELINGEAIPISAESQQSIKAYIDALPFLDTYTKAEINALLLGKQDTLTFDQAPTPGSSNPVTSSGIIAAMSALQSALEIQISAKADRASTYTKTQVDTLLEDKANADDVYSKNTMDAKLLEINNNIDNLDDELSQQSQQIANIQDEITPYIETTTTASRSYSIGEYFILNGFLRKATSVISTGSEITDNNSKTVSTGGFNDLSYKIIPYAVSVPANSEIALNYQSLFYDGYGVYLLACGQSPGILVNSPLAIIAYGVGGRIGIYVNYEGTDYWGGRISFVSSGIYDLKLKNTSTSTDYPITTMHTRKLM